MITLLIGLDAQTLFAWIFNNANYWLVFALMVVESSFVPFPSEVIVPPAAYIAASGSGNMNVYCICLVATAGALVGAMINYYLAMWVGRPVVYAFANSRIGHACLIDKQKVEKAEAYFDKHGAVSTFIGRLVPVIRQLISIPAGLARMNIAKFVLYTFLGAFVWNCALCFIGAWLEQLVDKDHLFAAVEQYNSYLTYAGILIGIGAIGFMAFNALKKKKSSVA